MRRWPRTKHSQPRGKPASDQSPKFPMNAGFARPAIRSPYESSGCCDDTIAQAWACDTAATNRKFRHVRWAGGRCSGAREELRGLEQRPVDRKSHPFARGGVGAAQPVTDGAERTPRILQAARAPVDRE